MANVTRDQVQQHISQHSAVIIESLSEESYAEGHIPGAIRLKADQVKELAPQLLKDKNQTIITYCGGEACSSRTDTAKALQNLGYKNVSEYAGGKADWKQAGLPLEKSAGASCSSGAGEMKGSCGTSKTGSCG
jgi:rhodanese-related sulfurtransferase